MSWKVTIGDKSMLLDDLSMEELDAVAQKHPETNWLALYTSPASKVSAFYSLLCAVAFKLQVPAPDRPRNLRETRALLDYIKQVDDDLPTQFGEGGVPLEEADGSETTTSSTSTEAEDGPPIELARRR